MKRIAVMVSGGGTNFQAIIDGVNRGEIDAELCLAISSAKDAYALERAQAAGIPTQVICKRDFETEVDFCRANLEALQSAGAEGVVLAGYLSIIGPEMVRAYRNRIINIHPSLIPSFCGMGYYGRRVHQAVIDYGAKLSGATTHFVDEGADTGPIILQESVPVCPEDTAETLAARVLEVEHRILPRTLALFCEGRLAVEGRIVRIGKTKKENTDESIFERMG